MAAQLDSFSTLSNWNLPLRIQRKGNFFSDDGFLDFRRHFESAATDLLQEFDLGRKDDVFSTYRRLRDKQLSGTDRTAKIAEEADKFKIVMDVEGFGDGNLEVKISGPNEIVVEGKQETKNGGGGAGVGGGGNLTTSFRSFKRRFSLPGLALVQDASSVVSSDNVLTISIPKKVTEITNESELSSSSTMTQEQTQQQQQQQLQQLQQQQQLLQQQQQKEQQQQILLQQQQQQQKEQIILQQQQEQLQKQQQQQKEQIILQQQQQQQTHTQETVPPSSIPSSPPSSLPPTFPSIWNLAIVPRASFFADSFFETVRQNFQKSVEEMVEKRRRGVSASGAGHAGLVAKVRETSEGNVQAVSVTEDAKEYKIVLDVHGFSDQDLTVRAVTECELVVEGKVEKKTEYTSCTHNFNKKFVLPSCVKIREASSALSSEGILTIVVPKSLEAIDYTIPVRTDAATNISHILKKDLDKEISSTLSSTQREQIVPVVQDEKITKTQQTVQQHSTISDTNASNVTDSQTLLNNLEKTIGTEHLTKKEHFVPINLEGEQIVKVSEQRQNTSYIVHEPSSVVKESQKLVSESTKLMEEVASNEGRVPTEHYVPVQLDAEITVNASNNAQFSNTNTQQQSNVSKNISSATDTSKTSIQEKTSSNLRARPSACRIIPISLKGSFYNESIFDDTRKSIDKEVQNVFTKYRQTSVIDEQKEETQGVQVSAQDTSSVVQSGQTKSTILDGAHSYKIVIDVYGFEEKDLSIRVSGTNEISIEGNSEKSKGNSISKQSFQRTFQLPNYVDLERTSTALSEEGILTVTVPKKNQLILLDKKATPVSSRLNKEVNKSKEEKTTLVIDSTGIVQESRSEKNQATATSGDVSQRTSSLTSSQNISSVPYSTESVTSDRHREFIVPLSVEDVSDVISEAGSVQSTSNLTSQMSTASNTSKDVSQNILSASTSASSMDSQIQNKSSVGTDNVIQVQGVNSSTDNNMSTMSNFNDQSRDIMTRTLFNLPIMSKGHFFDDSFFQDSRPMFESILRNKMNRFNRSTSFVDDLGFFQSLRENKLTSGNQMATLTEDDQFSKIVLDVHGFNESNLKVKALSENEILIEGEEEEKTGNSFSKKTFRKSFVLPGSVNLRSATSALSSDGVLTIQIPKC